MTAAPGVRTGRLRIALVSMPFVSVTRPSLQLGLLKALACRDGHRPKTFHLNLDFAARIGPELYERLCQHRGHQIGDWVFSVAAFDGTAPDPEDELLQRFGPAVDRLMEDEPSGGGRETLRWVRREAVPEYLDRVVDATEWGRFDVVGFTSTFQQNTASFALARRIKQGWPDVLVLFGGSNFEGEMGLEYVRAVPSIDYAISGEADASFPAFLAALGRGEDPAGGPGVVSRRDGEVRPPAEAPPFLDLDSLPVPDYDEYFQRAESCGLLADGPRRSVDLPFESARGCWWGQKHHCTFCGLNGKGIAFRSKSPDRVLREVGELVQRYRSFQLEAVDNILDMQHLRTVMAELGRRRYELRFFYELKSNLSRAQIAQLHAGGVSRVQPGIESLSTHVLRLMRKGVTGIRNVNTLRWLAHYDMSPGWNLLWGFPGETAEDYEEQVRVIRRIPHLPPPGGAGPIWLERFSPMYIDQAAFGARSVRAEASYHFVYPEHVDVDRAAYFFDYEFEEALPPEAYAGLAAAVKEWQERWAAGPRPQLRYWSAPGFLQVEDLRGAGEGGTFSFGAPLDDLYLACSPGPQTARGAAAQAGLASDVPYVLDALQRFTDSGLMLREGDRFLSLALPAIPLA